MSARCLYEDKENKEFYSFVVAVVGMNTEQMMCRSLKLKVMRKKSVFPHETICVFDECSFHARPVANVPFIEVGNV